MLNRMRVGAGVAAVGLVLSVVGATGVGTSLATGGVPEGSAQVQLHNQVADTNRTDCPDSLGDYWHFVLAPNSNTWSIGTISLQLSGPSEVVTFSGAQIIQNGTQLDNVFVRVPANHQLGDLVAPDDDSFAWYSPVSAGVVKNFNLSHTCDGAQTTTTSSSSSSTTTSSTTTTTTNPEVCHEQVLQFRYQKYTQSRTRTSTSAAWGPWSAWTVWSPARYYSGTGYTDGWGAPAGEVVAGPADHDGLNDATSVTDRDYRYQKVAERTVAGAQIPCETTTTSSTTTSTTSTSTTSTTSTTTTTTTTTLPPREVDAVCFEVVEGDDTSDRYWFQIGDEYIEGYDGKVVNVGETTVVLRVPDDLEQCTDTVTFTKKVAGSYTEDGGTLPDTYTIRVSRLVGQGGLTVDPNYDPIQVVVKADGTPTVVELPSTLDPDGIGYLIEEMVDGGATEVTIAVDGQTGNQVRVGPEVDESVSVVIMNAFASVEIDKRVAPKFVQPNQLTTYTLQVTNTGGLPLTDLVITDRMPTEVTFQTVVPESPITCQPPDANRDIVCVFPADYVLQPGDSTPKVIITATINPDVVPGQVVINQSRIVAEFIRKNPTDEVVIDGRRLLTRTEAVVDLSCPDPNVAPGTVCDLSPKDNGTATIDTTTSTTSTTTTSTTTSTTTTTVLPIVRSGGPLPTTTTVLVVPPKLPTTGGGSSRLVALGALMALFGLAMAAMARRREEPIA